MYRCLSAYNVIISCQVYNCVTWQIRIKIVIMSNLRTVNLLI